MGGIITKFGGFVLSDREKMEHAVDIELADERRDAMLVSASGKLETGPERRKVTDLLIEAAGKRDPGCPAAVEVMRRFREIGEDLGDVANNLCATLASRLIANPGPHYEAGVLAMGEYASARLVSEIINRRKGCRALFLEPMSIGFMAEEQPDGTWLPDRECFPAVRKKVHEMEAAMRKDIPEGTRILKTIPGFYLKGPDGNIVTITRQGSDVSETAFAAILESILCENATNEDGLRIADPTIVENPKKADKMIFDETTELAYRNFKLHGDAISYAAEAGIRMRVFDAAHPEKPGTYITKKRDASPGEYIIGVAAGLRKVPLTIVKPLMNKQVGFMESLTQMLKQKRISIEHVTTGMNSTTVYFDKKYIDTPTAEYSLAGEVEQRLGGDVSIDQIAVVAAVGVGMRNHVDSESRVLSAITRAGIKPLMIDFGPPGISMFVGIDERRADDAVKAVYNEFYGK